MAQTHTLRALGGQRVGGALADDTPAPLRRSRHAGEQRLPRGAARRSAPVARAVLGVFGAQLVIHSSMIDVETGQDGGIMLGQDVVCPVRALQHLGYGPSISSVPN